MYCDYPLDNDSTLEINLTKHLKSLTLFKSISMALTDENGVWNNKYASIITLVVSYKDNVTFSYFANVKHNRNLM